MGTETPKTVIITGVTRGLGEALAGRFIDAGHTAVSYTHLTLPTILLV